MVSSVVESSIKNHIISAVRHVSHKHKRFSNHIPLHVLSNRSIVPADGRRLKEIVQVQNVNSYSTDSCEEVVWVQKHEGQNVNSHSLTIPRTAQVSVGEGSTGACKVIGQQLYWTTEDCPVPVPPPHRASQFHMSLSQVFPLFHKWQASWLSSHQKMCCVICCQRLNGALRG